MFSYKEFPKQVESEMKEFAEEHLFKLIEKQDDHCLIYRNKIWELEFTCDHGLVELFLINLEDGFRYRLYDIIELWFPDLSMTKKIKENIWGSLKTVKFNVDVLGNNYAEIVENYKIKKLSLKEHKRISTHLINFIMNKGSEQLRNEFTWSYNKGIELASFEYSQSKNR